MSGIATGGGNRKVPKNYGTDTSGMGISPSTGIFIGIVKNNADPQNMGRLQVYVPEFGGKPDDESSWISVSYASPFAGSTSIFDQGGNVESYEDTMKSYGFWAVPPDKENKVLVGFASGRLDQGYWFACLYQRGTQVSVPGIPAKNTYGGADKPAAPKNKKDKDADTEKYVEHKPMSDALQVQGLDKDTTRGTTTSSSTRETPSKVVGLLTPGQHQFVMDDGDEHGHNKLIRLRTTNGVQLLLDDESGHIYMISRMGNSWVEISSDGQIHLYGAKDINIRSEANVNIRADKDVNIEAGQAINMSSAKDITLQSGANVQLIAKNDTMITSGQTSHISSSAGHYESAAVIHMNGPAATAATTIPLNSLTVNQGVKESVCTTVPEHEPWSGHAGSINPTGTGNQQMKQDPAPEQTPRQPEQGEQGAPINSNDTAKDEEVPVKDAKASDQVIDMIKDENGFTPVATDDANGQSVGFGSEVITGEQTPAPVENNTASIGESLFLSAEEDSLTASTQSLENTEVDDSLSILSSNVSEPTTGFMSKLNQSTNLNQALGASSTLSSASLNTPALRNTFVNEQSQILSEGVSANKASQLLLNDITKSENSVKTMLAGVDTIPKNVFDGLVSFHNQVGDASYAFVKGEKIDLTNLYKNGEWDRAASFIAADERDRSRRIKEAGMIASNNYPVTPSEMDIVTRGLNKTDELIAKGKLNQQTGKPATVQQALAATSSYFGQLGTMMPSVNSATQLKAIGNITSNNITNMIKRQAGPWPY